MIQTDIPQREDIGIKIVISVSTCIWLYNWTASSKIGSHRDRCDVINLKKLSFECQGHLFLYTSKKEIAI